MMFSFLQLDSQSELELKEENEDDYAMSSECSVEVSLLNHEAFII